MNAGPLVVTYAMTRSRRAIVEEELGGTAEAIYLVDLAPAARAHALGRADALSFNNYTILHARTAFDDVDTPEEDRRHLPRLWLEAPWMRKVHPHAHLFEGNVGIEAVSGRTPSFDWRPLISDRIDHVVTPSAA